MSPYKFLFPPPAELEVRRKNLNTAGFLAWSSPPALIILVALARFVISRLNHNDNVRPAVRLWRRVQWTLSTTYVSEFGPLYVQVIGTAYASWLIYLAFRNTGDDYMHLTKQFGHVAVSQLPWQYLLAFKSPRSPITLLLPGGLTHERLNAFHRFFGRIIHALLAVHVLLYLNFFLRLGLLEKRIRDRDVRLGIIAFWMFNFLAILAIPVVRKRAYHNLFYRSHVVLSGGIPVALWFHQPWTRWYLLQAAVFYIANAFSRRSARAPGTIVTSEKLAGKDLVKVVVQVKQPLKPRSEQWLFVPGEHAYLRATAKTGSLISPANPFTVVDAATNAADGSTEITFVIRTLGGPGTRFQLQRDTPQQVFIEGPYGEAQQYFPKLLHEVKSSNDAGQILLVAGGVGATYALPIYAALTNAATRSNNLNRLKLIWFVKTAGDAQWGIDFLEQHAAFLKNVDIYIRQSPFAKHDLSVKGGTVHHVESRPDLTALVERALSTKNDQDKDTNEKAEVQKRSDKSPITVLVCGPPELSRQLRQAVGRYVLTGNRQVRWFEEQFGLGG